MLTRNWLGRTVGQFGCQKQPTRGRIAFGLYGHNGRSDAKLHMMLAYLRLAMEPKEAHQGQISFQQTRH